MQQTYNTAPVLYLNSLEHQGKQFIRLWYKPDHRITKLLKDSKVAKYSKTYKCYVTHKTPEAIELLHRHFQGVALVDTRYLNRAKRLRPALGAVVTSGSLQSEPLAKLPVIRLQPLHHFNITIVDNGYEIDVTSITSEGIRELVEWLPNDMGLEFYDYEGHEYQNDRDGSYIDVQRYEDEYAFKGGNHGRSSGWERISKHQLMEFIMHDVKQKDAFIHISPILQKVDDWDESYLKNIK